MQVVVRLLAKQQYREEQLDNGGIITVINASIIPIVLIQLP